MTNEKDMVDAFEKLSEAGHGILAIPPQSEEEHKERDRLMQNYLLQRKSEKVAAPRE